MRLAQFPLGALLIGLLQVALAQQDLLGSLSPCGVQCYNSVVANNLGCDSGDKACLCETPNFAFGMRDCAVQACEPEDVDKVAEFSSSLCAADFGEPAPSDPAPAVTSAPPVEAAPSPEPTPAPSSAPAPPVSEEGDEEEPSSSSPEPSSTRGTNRDAESAESSEVPSTTATSLSSNATPESTSPDGTTDGTSTIETESGATSEPSADSAKTTGDDDGEDESAGVVLSTPAIIGIGVGAGVAAIGSVVALLILCRRRKKARTRSLQISEPMPGSGRDYSGGLGSVSDKNLTELEIKSKRYEDMIPRQSPRSMI